MKISIDDGCQSDIRVAELAKKYNVECIFYWPVDWYSLALANGYKPIKYNDATWIVKDFEIGSHTITHRHLTKLDTADAEVEILHSKYILEDLWGTVITKFCPPRGYTNDELTKYTLFYYESQRLTKGAGLVHIHPNSGANNNIDWRMRIKLMQEHGQEVKEIWGHSWEFDKYNLWGQLEEYLSAES